MIDPVAEPGKTAEPRPRRSTRLTAERDDVRYGGAGSNVLRDEYGLVDADERCGSGEGPDETTRVGIPILSVVP